MAPEKQALFWKVLMGPLLFLLPCALCCVVLPLGPSSGDPGALLSISAWPSFLSQGGSPGPLLSSSPFHP